MEAHLALGVRQATLAKSNVERVGQELLIVGSKIEDDGEGLFRANFEVSGGKGPAPNENSQLWG